MRTFNTVKDIQIERENQRANTEIYTLLGVLLGEIDRLPTREAPSADQIYTVVNRMYNNAMEMAQYSAVSKIEMNYLKDFIKAQLTDAQLVELITKYRDEGFNNIGALMKVLNTQHKGQFNGKTASTIINQMLK